MWHISSRESNNQNLDLSMKLLVAYHTNGTVLFIRSFTNLSPLSSCLFLSFCLFFLFSLFFSVSKVERIELHFTLSFCGHAQRNWKKRHTPQGSATTPE